MIIVLSINLLFSDYRSQCNTTKSHADILYLLAEYLRKIIKLQLN